MDEIKKVRFLFTNEGDAEFPAMGAFRQYSMQEGAPYIRFNMDTFCYYASQQEQDKSGYIKDCLLEIITHEFCHAFQEYLNMELSEEVVDKILSDYNESWKAKEGQVVPEEHEPMVDAQSVIEMFETLLAKDSLEDVKASINGIMPSLKSWGHKG